MLNYTILYYIILYNIMRTILDYTILYSTLLHYTILYTIYYILYTIYSILYTLLYYTLLQMGVRLRESSWPWPCSILLLGSHFRGELETMCKHRSCLGQGLLDSDRIFVFKHKIHESLFKALR